MSSHDETEISDLDSDLVAYLDGELDPEASRAIEERLAKDESARSRLRALERSWDALDELPRAAVDESFTRSTVEMIAISASTEVDEMEADHPARRKRRWIASAVAVAAAAAIGFSLVYFAWPDPNRQLVEDLPVLEHLDEYTQVRDIDFLRRLAKEDLFTEGGPDAK